MDKLQLLSSKPQPLVSTVIPHWKMIRMLDRQLSDKICICKNTCIIGNAYTPKMFRNQGLGLNL